MLGRMLKVLLLALVLAGIFKWLLAPDQRARVNEFTGTVARALLLGSVIILVLYYLGVSL
ncbi:hypothetical protein ABWL39_14475 [Chitinivorax sp. PXF-14]|uniref:protein MIGRI n=1 Tax=Chitinivorax sp. PXF-14 TaxID=3230488 RepID=UPI003467D831